MPTRFLHGERRLFLCGVWLFRFVNFLGYNYTTKEFYFPCNFYELLLDFQSN
jgi:hypothetical protein